MSDKIKIRITPAVARFAAAGADMGLKLKGLEEADSMSPADQLMLTFCLMKDRNDVVKGAATGAFNALTEETVLSFLLLGDVHPAVLEAIAKAHCHNSAVVKALLVSENLESQTRDFLQEQLNSSAESEIDIESLLTEDLFTPIDDEQPDFELLGEGADGDDSVSSDQPDPDSEVAEEQEYLSKYKMVQLMDIGEKIKMALTGDKEWRSILIKDANKLVSGSVIKNPRITDGEVLNIIKVGVQNDEIIRLICANKEWTKIYPIRKALIENPKTPLSNALRYLSTLSDKDVASYAKSRNISSVIATQAKRLVLAKKR
jgi:hypothetical protein